MKMKTIISLALLVISCYACSDEDELNQASNHPISIFIPDYFPEVKYPIQQNMPTDAGVKLGKKLFYDGRLSANNVISCGFCHQQEFAFTHHGHSVSHGVDNGIGFRNSQPIQNLIFFDEFNWDGASIHLELQPIIPITSDFEMGESLENIIQKLKTDDEYNQLFKVAFNEDISADNILKALAQFMATMVSAQSKYDEYLQGNSSVLTNDELQGLSLFNQQCSSCHSGALFTNQEYMNNGLPVNPNLRDIGRMRVTGVLADSLRFRVPSLRNVAKSFPYMHDGRFQTLEAVLNHYRNGIVQHPTLAPELQNGIVLTDQEVNQIISFLNTLTDETFLTDERFAEF